MKVQVEMLAFMENGTFREVEIPNVKDQNVMLDSVFYYGQNDFQPQQMPSVSAGDVIYLNGKKILIKGAGFKELSEEEYRDYCNLPQRDRSFVAITM